MTSRGASQPRRLTVTVHQGRDLVNKDGFLGKNDVYCLLDLRATWTDIESDGEQLRTTVVDQGGAEPCVHRAAISSLLPATPRYFPDRPLLAIAGCGSGTRATSSRGRSTWRS